MTMVTNPTEELANFITAFSYDDLPKTAQDFTRNWLLDSLGCALVGDLGAETAQYMKFARAIGGAGSATVIGSCERMSMLGASLINGFQITAVTLCDTYLPAHVHIGPEIIPPALAIAERDGLSGKALLAALAIGAETAIRVAIGVDYSVAGALGWHMPGIVGPFGAAAAAGHLRGLSPLQMRNALGLAGSQSAGTWASWGTAAVKFHQSRGAASGLLAATLAETDFIASPDILGKPDGGLFAAYSDGGKPDAMLDGLGTRYELEQLSLRLWPGGASLQPTLTAVFDLLANENIAFGSIQKVRIIVAPSVVEAHNRYSDPKGVFDALNSCHFTVASALHDGQFWLDSVSAEKIADPELKQFISERVELVGDAGLNNKRARVEIDLPDGRTVSAQANAAKGTPGNPAEFADLQAKFQRCTAGRLKDADARELLDMIVGLEDVSNLERLFALLASAHTRKG